jgi:hypothetical protein
MRPRLLQLRRHYRAVTRASGCVRTPGHALMPAGSDASELEGTSPVATPEWAGIAPFVIACVTVPVLAAAPACRAANRAARTPTTARTPAARRHTGSGRRLPMREDARTKGSRYITEGRLFIRYAGPEGVRASCRGGGTMYSLGWDRKQGWWCSCEARSRCAHIHALMLVALAPRTSSPMGDTGG